MAADQWRKWRTLRKAKPLSLHSFGIAMDVDATKAKDYGFITKVCFDSFRLRATEPVTPAPHRKPQKDWNW